MERPSSQSESREHRARLLGAGVFRARDGRSPHPRPAPLRASLAAVCHQDNTGRLHTVKRSQNPLYYDLIKAFQARTGTPVLLNTSFNENEPIVDHPSQAVACFVRTDMDVLVLGPFITVKRR